MTVMMVVAQSIKRQEYWIDSDYGNRQSMGTSSTPSATISTAGLSPGVHFFNHRAMNSDNEWGTLYRYMFFIPEQMDVEVAKVEYWIDNDYQNVVRRQVSSSSLDCLLSISGLASGLHFFNLRPINAAGDYGVLRRTAFFIPAEETAYVAGYEYWIDDDTPTEVSNGVTGGFFSLIIDVPELTEGEHTFSFRAKNISNVWGDVFTSKFTISGSIEAAPYAVFNNGTLTFYCDNQRSSREGTTYDLNKGSNAPGWKENAENITTAKFDASFANASPTSTRDWFYGCKNVTEIQDIKYLNTSEVTQMGNMFYGCSSLTNLDLSNFNTGKVSYMFSMFYGCSGLTSLDVSHFNTANVTSMNMMFDGCSSLTTLDVSHFNTSKVTDMDYMFMNCKGLTSLDLSSFDTSKTKSMRMMFTECSSLTNLDISYFNTANVASMYCMFSGCSSLTNIDLSKFNTANVTNMAGMFSNCKALSNINVSGFDTKKVTTMDWMFDGCNNLTSLDLSNFDTNALKDVKAGTYAVGDYAIDNMFSNCSKLSKLTLGSGFVTTDELKCDYVFGNCPSLKTVTFTGDIPASINSNFFKYVGLADSPALLDVPEQYKSNYAAKFSGNMFYGGYFTMGGTVDDDIITFADANVKAICVENWDTNGDGELSKAEAAAVTIIGTVFKDNKTIQSFDEFKYFTGVISLDGYAFYNCSNLASITLPNTLTTIGSYAFYGCKSLTDVILPSTLTSIGSFGFWWCNNFTTITIPNSVTSIGTAAFAGCTSLETINVESGNAFYDSRNNCNAIIRKSDNALISGCKNTIIPNSVTSISNYAFRSCQELVAITIPNTITSIGYEAFGYCYGLSSITIPASVSSIGDYAFRSCNALTEVKSMIMQPFAIADNVFQRYINNVLQFTTATLYVPYGTKAKYEATDGWKNFTNIVEMGDINGDGKVDVSDYIGVANHILGNTPEGFDAAAADVNNDGVVDVSDYIGVANIILTGSPYGK